MTKKNKKIILITSMITILPILAGLILWNKLPEQVATHFDFNGIPNGYSSRAFAVFGPYLICLFAHLLCAFGTLADPKKQAIGQKMYALILWICPAVSLFCAAAIYGNTFGVEFMKSSRFVIILLGLLFLLVGNYLPKCRQNYTVGIKVPVDTRQRSKLGCNSQDGRKIVGCRRRVDSSAGHSAVDPGISDKSGAHTCGHIYSDDLFLCILSEK